MRPDIGKVITERPRRGGGIKAPKGERKLRNRIPLDEQPKRESIRRKWVANWSGKEFTDVLGPLIGFLNKNVGRPWDKICSEINEVLPATGGVSLSHARDHLFQFVAEKVILIDKKVYTPDGRVTIYQEFFVHPKTGILLRTKESRYRRKYKREYEKKYVVVDENHQLHQGEDGIWYELTLERVESKKTKYWPYLTLLANCHDVFIGLVTDASELKRTYGEVMRAVKKRQLNGRELKRRELKNTVME